MTRVGLALYGIDPLPSTSLRANKVSEVISSINEIASSSSTPRDDGLRPVLKLTTKIIQIKTLQKGDGVGYNGTFTATRSMRLGVLPIGYYDGVDRRSSNKGYVTVDKIECPIAGLVSMNVTTIDLSTVKNPHIGQNVCIYSSNPNDKNSIENTAEICKTIPYDLLVHLASSTKRVIV